eukprot:CCRYP_015231-RA/>CCRYP_015231-RA protein AED:0.44 eAED:0.59 QI:327/0/0.5/1/0/0/2/0/69
MSCLPEVVHYSLCEKEEFDKNPIQMASRNSDDNLSLKRFLGKSHELLLLDCSTRSVVARSHSYMRKFDL